MHTQVKELQKKVAEKAEQLAESQREHVETLDLEDLHSQLTELRQDVGRLEQVCQSPKTYISEIMAIDVQEEQRAKTCLPVWN